MRTNQHVWSVLTDVLVHVDVRACEDTTCACVLICLLVSGAPNRNTSPTRDPPRSSPQSPSSPTLSTPDPRKGTRNPSLEVHMHTYAHAPKWKVSSERVVFPKLSPRQRMGEDGVLRPFDLPLSLSKVRNFLFLFFAATSRH